MSSLILIISTFPGTASIITLMQSAITGIVVKITRIENRNVQIGSAIAQSCLIVIIIAAITTPTLYIISPIT
jgi:hypothetical protein